MTNATKPFRITDLMPCPYCGGVGDLAIGAFNWTGLYAVNCQKCDAFGPERANHDAAGHAWNKRSKRVGRPRKYRPAACQPAPTTRNSAPTEEPSR